LWPGLILERGEASVQGSIEPVVLAECSIGFSGTTLSGEQEAGCMAEFGLAARESASAGQGWTAYGPIE
jgi:hypothetical protein